ncbi:ABC transporter ATP-binding protein [Streptomyces sp. NPDC054794]
MIRRARSTALGTALALAWRAAPWHIAALLVVTAAGATVPVAVASLTRLTLNTLAGAGDTALLGLALGLAALGVATAVMTPLTTYLGNQLDRATAFAAVSRVYSAVNSLVGLSRLENPGFQNRLRVAQSAGSQAIGGVLEAGLGLVGGALTAAGFIGALYVLSPAMTAAVLLCVVPLLMAELRLARRRALGDWRASAAQRRSGFYEMLLSSLEAAKEIRLFGAGGFLLDRMLAARRIADTERRAVDRRELLTQGALALLAAAVGGAGLVWAALAARRGELTVGDVALFVVAVAGVQGALGTLVRSVAQLHHLLLIVGHYQAVVGAAPDPTLAEPPDEAVSLPALREGIEFRDVWFRYDEGHPWVLRGVSFRIPYGQALALVGHNGAGKSTLVKLLCRFYDPTRGAVLWDGVDIRRVPVAELRRRLGAVFQDYVEYDLTAAENIAIGDVTAMDDRPRLQSAARAADIDGVLAALPRGYDTLLSRLFSDDGHDGRTSAEAGSPSDAIGALLSGGQWQRVALARAFLRTDPDLLILDEPSSGLDAEAEHDIHQRLTCHRKDRTSLLISHRLGAVRAADRIIVLSEGRIIEEGTHGGLVERRGTYARLFELQARGYRR